MKDTDKVMVIGNSEDGEVYIEVMPVSKFKARLNEDYYGEAEVFTAKDIEAAGGAHGAWDFANYGPRGIIVVPLSSVLVPKPKQRVTEWEL